MNPAQAVKHQIIEGRQQKKESKHCCCAVLYSTSTSPRGFHFPFDRSHLGWSSSPPPAQMKRQPFQVLFALNYDVKFYGPCEQSEVPFASSLRHSLTVGTGAIIPGIFIIANHCWGTDTDSSKQVRSQGLQDSTNQWSLLAQLWRNKGVHHQTGLSELRCRECRQALSLPLSRSGGPSRLSQALGLGRMGNP